MMRGTYQTANVTKAWWSLCQWWSLCNECEDKRTSNIMKYFARSVRRPWEDVVWSHMKKIRCGCESHIYTWLEKSGNWMAYEMKPRLIFWVSKLNESRRSRNGWRRYSLRDIINVWTSFLKIKKWWLKILKTLEIFASHRFSYKKFNEYDKLKFENDLIYIFWVKLIKNFHEFKPWYLYSLYIYGAILCIEAF
jgi:hypothetical protein